MSFESELETEKDRQAYATDLANAISKIQSLKKQLSASKEREQGEESANATTPSPRGQSHEESGDDRARRDVSNALMMEEASAECAKHLVMDDIIKASDIQRVARRIKTYLKTACSAYRRVPLPSSGNSSSTDTGLSAKPEVPSAREAALVEALRLFVEECDAGIGVSHPHFAGHVYHKPEHWAAARLALALLPDTTEKDGNPASRGNTEAVE